MTCFAQLCVVKFFIFLYVFLLTCGNEVSEPSKEGLPFCGLTTSSSRYIFVSTLDGKLTALNPNDGGSVLWTIHPGSESLLSSSIHKLELSNYGHLVRMIPSLNGGLYKFNGENVEVIPVTVDHLLQSSFKYSDDLVMSGGKETKTYGVSLKSGQIIYECSMKGCGNVSQSTDGGEVLVIQRLNQIVRAVEPRSGTEKWNFSVAQHDLKILSDCHSEPIPELDYQLLVIVPEGMIYATDIKDSSHIKWKHKFNSPVVNVWQLYKGKLIEVDLFSHHQPSLVPVPPSIYIGMYDKQLYIQESVVMLKKRQLITSKVQQKLIGSERNFPKIPWKPVLASSTALGLINQKVLEDKALDDASQRQTTALSVLYASPYVDGSGFYLYTEDEMEKVKKASCNTSVKDTNLAKIEENVDYDNADSDFILKSDFESDLSDANTPVEIVIVSFWYYWKEVLVISITTAFLCNIMITRTYLRWKIKGLSKASETIKSDSSPKENDSGVDLGLDKFPNFLESSPVQDYVSRYLTDFDPVACLGRGGFGVVFEAKNKIDDCHYAIKRILLPNRLESRDRVLREVKALAKLDHHHIVRYFNAWTECPPPGWQEEHDRPWVEIESDNFMCSGTNSAQNTLSSEEATNISSSILSVNSVFPKPIQYCVIDTQNSNSEININKNEISDSFIVFGEDIENSESNGSKKINIGESVITVDSVTQESCKSKEEITTNSNRPTSLMLQANASVESQHLGRVYLYIQMQLCQRQSLKDWLTINKERDYKNVLSIFEQILQAVEHVHLQGLIHRDLKPSNIFFSLDNQIKVGDFGLVTAMTEGDVQMSPIEDLEMVIRNKRHTAQVGTQLYMSREQLLGKPYNYKVDIYSLGLILFELLVPFNTQMERIRVLQDIKIDKYPNLFREKYKKEYELLRLMLSHSPDERPTTYGIRARLPLRQEPVEEDWHFELPMRRRTSSKTSRASTSSNEGPADSR